MTAKKLDELTEKLRDPDEYIRGSAVEELGEMGIVALDALRQALHDPYWDVRRTAVDALVEIGPAALDAPHDTDGEVGIALAEVLGDMGEVALELLLKALHDKDVNARSIAADALGRIDHPRARDALVPMLSDPDEDVRHHAAYSLGELRDPRAVQTLIAALTNEEWAVCYNSSQALRKIGTPEAIEAAAAWEAETIRETLKHLQPQPRDDS